jgi:GH24 family phage-related lysozyme (muramidase)
MKTVKDAIAACDTGQVRGLSQQIIAVMNSIVPNALVNFDDLNVDVRGNQINPFLQPAAKESLRLAISERGTKLVVNSAYRTIVQQYIIRRQFELGICGIPAAARPGLSNHESGLALDVEDPDRWQPFFGRHNWIRLGAFDPPHYDYKFPAATRRDISTIGIKAFQQLWNQHNPDDIIAEDGIFGPATASRLERSPADGFQVVEALPLLRLQDPPLAGESVERLQESLVRAGFSLEVNGVFDAATDRAVRQFQESMGLIIDGIVGEMTLRALETPNSIGTRFPREALEISQITVEGLSPETLSTEERYALNILLNLSLADFNKLKELMQIGQLGVLGPTTLVQFLKLCQDLGFDLSESGVNAFKEKHQLGNTGTVRGVIGPQTAKVYFEEIVALSTTRGEKSGRKINNAGLDLVKEFEGLARRLPDGRIAAYLDVVGVPTIGYGHTKGVALGQIITVQQAEDFLREDLIEAESAVSEQVRVTLNDNQFSALVSFVFNLGAGALNQSTLLRELNIGNYTAAANEFPRWVNAGGQRLPGLVRRRAAERELFLS